MDGRKDVIPQRVAKACNGLPRAGVESPPLETFENHVDVVLRDLV